MRATFKLLNSYFWKTIYGPILAFVFPVLLLAILGNIMRVEYVFPGIVALSSMLIAILAMPLGLMEMKNSTLFKFIGSSPVNNKKYAIVTIAFYVFIDFAALILIMIFGMIFFSDKVFPNYGAGLYSGIFTVGGFFSFLIANLMHIMLGLAIGLAIATFSKTPQQALTIGLVVALPSMFLSGMVLTVDIIAQSDVMQWISRLTPFRYTTGNIIVSATPLDQMGDLMSHLSYGDKTIIFNNVADAAGVTIDGHHFAIGDQYLDINGDGLADVDLGRKLEQNDVVAKVGQDQYVILHTHADVAAYSNQILDSHYQSTNIKDPQLFNMLFIYAPDVSVSTNNIFDFTSNWGVSKIPDPSVLESFVKDYFFGNPVENPDWGIVPGAPEFIPNDDPSRFVEIWNQIQSDGTPILNADGTWTGERIDGFAWINMFFKQSMTLFYVADRVLNIFLPIVLSVGLLWYVAKKFKFTAR